MSRDAVSASARSCAEGDARPPPLVSIIICNYNYARFLRFAIDSALAQSYGNVEVIVVDDGSTDSSRTVIDEYVVKGGVRAIYQDNRGQFSAYNAGFAASAGDIVLFLDADDMYLPGMVDEVVAALDGQTAKAHFRLAFIGPDGGLRGGRTPRTLSSGDVGRLLLTQGVLYSSAPGSGNAYARRALVDLFPLPVPEDRHGADFFTVYGSALNGRVVALDSVLGCYRLHGASDEDSASLVFGNAARQGNETERLKARVALFRSHVKQRLDVDLPGRLMSFSTQKQEFVVEALRDTGYVRRLAAGHAQAAGLWHVLRRSPDFPLVFKACIAIWAVLVVILPRAVALPLARYVSNPASR